MEELFTLGATLSIVLHFYMLTIKAYNVVRRVALYNEAAAVYCTQKEILISVTFEGNTTVTLTIAILVTIQSHAYAWWGSLYWECV